MIQWLHSHPSMLLIVSQRGRPILTHVSPSSGTANSSREFVRRLWRDFHVVWAPASELVSVLRAAPIKAGWETGASCDRIGRHTKAKSKRTTTAQGGGGACGYSRHKRRNTGECLLVDSVAGMCTHFHAKMRVVFFFFFAAWWMRGGVFFAQCNWNVFFSPLMLEKIRDSHLIHEPSAIRSKRVPLLLCYWRYSNDSISPPIASCSIHFFYHPLAYSFPCFVKADKIRLWLSYFGSRYFQPCSTSNNGSIFTRAPSRWIRRKRSKWSKRYTQLSPSLIPLISYRAEISCL